MSTEEESEYGEGSLTEDEEQAGEEVGSYEEQEGSVVGHEAQVSHEYQMSTEFNMEELDEALETGNVTFGSYGPNGVNPEVFEELKLPSAMVTELKEAWDTFLAGYNGRMEAGEAIYSAIFEAAPSLQNMFKTARAVQGMRFVTGLSQIIDNLHSPGKCKIHLETLSFQHLDTDVTGPRVQVWRDAIMDLVAQQLGGVSPAVQISLLTMMNWMGSAFIFVRTKYVDRVQLILESWALANDRVLGEDGELLEASGTNELSPDEPTEELGKSTKRRKGRSGEKRKIKVGGAGGGDGSGKEKVTQVSGDLKKGNQAVPQTFNDMFAFNTAVMGFSSHTWMGEILLSFDVIVTNTANSYRLQEECDVVSLRLAKYKGQLILSDFKSVMLASLRSLVKDWGSAHEVAWSWLWSNVERLLQAMLGKPKHMESALSAFLKSIDEETMAFIRREIYSKFFTLAPGGQDYFKQSTTRLHFIADKVVSMTMDMYKDPKKLVEDISALGLRHVGYGIPTPLFSPFVTCTIQVVASLTKDPTAEEAFRWSLGLLSRILVRVIIEGSTIVMKAINANSAPMLRRAADQAPRGRRALWMLNVQVGTQSISPFMLAIKNGALEAGEAILKDLLTIRADRDRYYYGADALFARHPDVIRRVCLDAPPLLPVLLNGLIWRSRTTESGLRRVNYYVKHLIFDEDTGFAKATEWLCDFEEPQVMCGPVVALVTNTVWNQLIFRSFLLGKAWFLFTLTVFCCAQSIFMRHGDDEDLHTSQAQLIAVAGLRLVNYIFTMGVQVRHHTGRIVQSIRDKELIWYKRIPIPTYLHRWQEVVRLLLTVDFLIMLAIEPVLHCLASGGDRLFNQSCEAGQSMKTAYCFFSAIGIICYFALLTDLSVLSTRVSAFVLVCQRVASEVILVLFSSIFVVLIVAFAACALEQDDPHFNGIGKSILFLVKMTLGMVAGDEYDILEHEPILLVCILFYMVLISIFLLNMLVAQLTCAYQGTYDDMVGYARLNRGRIIVESVPKVKPARWEQFKRELDLDTPIEFGEGDIGLAGGIQVLEPASLNIMTVDMIKRFGGTTSPSAQWPAEETSKEERDKYTHLDRVVDKALKKMGRMVKGSVAGSSTANGSQAGGGSVLNSSSDADASEA